MEKLSEQSCTQPAISGGAAQAKEADTYTLRSEARSQGKDPVDPTPAIDASPTPSSDSEGLARAPPVGDVFGDETNADIHYKTCTWWNTAILMTADTISLGVLALPQALASLGFVPGLLLILILGIIATWSAYIIGQFKLAYPFVQSFADCGFLIAGPIGREIMAFAQLLILIFISAAHILSFAIALNVMSEHSQCTVVFSVIALIVCFLFTLPRTLKHVSYFSIFSCLSIIIAVTVAMTAIAIQKPDVGHIVAVRPGVSLVKGLGPVMNIILAYAGHVAFFGMVSELKDPREFTKSLLLNQIFAVTFYMLLSSVIYYYAGPFVASPALGSASPLVRKIAFGIALPTIVIAGVINIHVACKYVYLRLCGAEIAHKNSLKSLSSWVGIVAVAWILAFIIAEGIPNFNALLGLIAALFSSWFSYGLPPMLWLYQHRGSWWRGKKQSALTLMNFALIALGAAICALGMWASGWELAHITAGDVFSCKNNWSPSVGG